MKAKATALATFAAFHAVVIVTGMMGLRPEPKHWSAPIAYWYSRLTGAGGSFGFFSPNIPREVIVSFEVEEKDGLAFTTTLKEVSNLEIAARMTNMMRLLGKSFYRDDVMRAVAASLTAEVYRRHPTARAVTLKASVFYFPDLERFSEGERERLIPIYSAKFERRAVRKVGAL